MNHPGEIAELAHIAQPTVALVNNAQREHQEFMASVEAVARENGAAIAALPEIGVAVYPAEDAQAPLWREMAGQRARLTFAATPGAADVSADARWTASPNGRCLGLGAAHSGRQRSSLQLQMAGATTCTTRWPPHRRRPGGWRAADGRGRGACRTSARLLAARS